MGKKNKERVAYRAACTASEAHAEFPGALEMPPDEEENVETRGLPEEHLEKPVKFSSDVFEQLAQKEAEEERLIAEAKLKAINKLKQRRLTAAEAREITDTSLLQVTRLYKYIREMASEGCTQIEWDISYLSDACKDKLIETLKDDGYTILNQKKKIIIRW